ncbi:MAG: hypothetical protein ACI8PG_003554, partial [Planctomycetota bacterium]
VAVAFSVVANKQSPANSTALIFFIKVLLGLQQR